MTPAGLERQAQALSLTISAGLDARRCAGRSDLPPGTRTLLLLSPHEPAFWPAFQASPEYNDARPDPMDRWSQRVIGHWAAQIGAIPLFPFGGPPFHPFVAWALASGQVHQSPVGMLVHPQAGLFVSFRGALALPDAVPLPKTMDCPHPCNSCPDQPCLTSCPAGAFQTTGYDVPRCKSHLITEAGLDCMSKGCAVRRACPKGKFHGRIPEHSAFHMSYFL